jgi:pantoate--beta-alanine ligase
MGALHEGHLSLVRLAKERAQHVVATIFINPAQFDDPADLAAYPKTVEQDLELLDAAGADIVWLPEAEELYPVDELPVTVDVPTLTSLLEGAERPGHFIGVCRVVMKLFNVIQPHLSVFGEKDYQQLRIIEEMVRGLDLPIEIVRGPIVREPDGLAMSSRNRRLSAEDRDTAARLSEILLSAATDTKTTADRVTERLASHFPAIDYVTVVDPQTLRPSDQRPARLLAAVRVGGVRLIDNVELS